MDTKKIISDAAELHDIVAGFRRHLHRHPELSFREHDTADYITRILENEGIRCRRVADTGVLAKIEGRGEPCSAVVLRADIDALPVAEAADAPYASENHGVMHACGHDLHTAALLGAVILLHRRRQEIGGTVFGLFQPGEELVPGGAAAVLAEDPFAGYDIRAFYGQHVDPELPTGVFGFRPGKYMASTDELYFTVRGEGGHGAMRGTVRDPVQAAAAFTGELLRAGNANGGESVLSIGRFMAEGATNIIPDKVEMQGTLRTFDEGLRTALKGDIRRIASGMSAGYGVDIEADIRDGFPGVVNSPRLTEAAIEKFRDIFGEDAVVALDRRMTGEDFGYYTRRYPSLFYRFGVGGAEKGRAPGQDRQPVFTLGGNAGRLHSPLFRPDERALSYAVAGLVCLALS